MAKLCPFKKETQTTIEYGYASIEREKPVTVKKDEHFGICNGLQCMAYDGGICLLVQKGV